MLVWWVTLIEFLVVKSLLNVWCKFGLDIFFTMLFDSICWYSVFTSMLTSKFGYNFFHWLCMASWILNSFLFFKSNVFNSLYKTVMSFSWNFARSTLNLPRNVIFIVERRNLNTDYDFWMIIWLDFLSLLDLYFSRK